MIQSSQRDKKERKAGKQEKQRPCWDGPAQNVGVDVNYIQRGKESKTEIKRKEPNYIRGANGAVEAEKEREK